MITKYPVCTERIRKIPGQFSWVDHRLVRNGYIDRCSHPGAALYLFLLTVADAKGLSYYSDFTLSRRIHLDDQLLVNARRELIHIGLIAYQKPLYQVLAIEDGPLRSLPVHRNPNNEPVPIGSVLKTILGESR